MSQDETLDSPNVRQIVRILFDNDLRHLERSLVGASKGNRAKAFDVAKASLARYNIELTEHEFDWACATVNDGVEFEWSS